MSVVPVDDELFVVAIDGPAGAGKSTVGRALASRLGLEYLDTGAMYRAVTFAALRAGIALDDHAAVGQLSRALDLVVADGRVEVDGVDAAAAIRGPEVTKQVSAVAANAEVRAELVQRQRHWARQRGGGVLEGRDIGSVVFPNAALKVYLTASARVRAERRQQESGGDVAEIEASIAERDRKDRERADGPLTRADGATVVDTSGKSIDEVLREIESLMESRR